MIDKIMAVVNNSQDGHKTELGKSVSVISTIAGIAKRFVMDGMEAALNRKKQENRRRKVTGDVEARICAIACSAPPEGASRWTMQAVADELIRLEAVDYITDTTVCEVMKKTRSNRGL